MDKFLEMCNLAGLNHEIETLNRPVTSEDIGSIIANLPAEESPGSLGFTGECFQRFKEEPTPILIKLYRNVKSKGDLFTYSESF